MKLNMARQFVLRTNTLKRLDLYVKYPNNICISENIVVFLQKRIKTKGWIKIKQRFSVLNVVALMAVVYPFSIKKPSIPLDHNGCRCIHQNRRTCTH